MGKVLAVFEQLVLWGIANRGNRASADMIREEILAAGYSTSFGGLWTTLHRLERKSPPLIRRLPEDLVVDGERRKVFSLTTEGREALSRAMELSRTMLERSDAARA